MNRVLTLRSLKFSEQREEEHQSKVTPNFALLNEFIEKKNSKSNNHSSKKGHNNTSNPTKLQKENETEEKINKNTDNASNNVLFGTQKSSLIAITHENVSTSGNTQQATTKSTDSKKSASKSSGLNDDEKKDKGSVSTAAATSNAMNRFSAPILVDEALAQRRSLRENVEERGIFCSLGHAYVCQGDVELGVPDKDIVKSFRWNDDKILIDKQTNGQSEDNSDDGMHKMNEEKSNADLQNDEASNTILKLKSKSKPSPTKTAVAISIQPNQETLMDDIRFNSAQVRLDTITRWRNEFDATKQKKDRELIKKLVSRDEARKFVLSSQETMEKSIQRLLIRTEKNKHTQI